MVQEEVFIKLVKFDKISRIKEYRLSINFFKLLIINAMGDIL